MALHEINFEALICNCPKSPYTYLQSKPLASHCTDNDLVMRYFEAVGLQLPQQSPCTKQFWSSSLAVAILNKWLQGCGLAIAPTIALHRSRSMMWACGHHDDHPLLSDFEAAVLLLPCQSNDFRVVGSWLPQQLPCIKQFWSCGLAIDLTITLHWAILKQWTYSHPQNFCASNNYEALESLSRWQLNDLIAVG